MRENTNIKILVGEVPGYKLLDSGGKQKLEEIGGVKIKRAEPRAWWHPQGAPLGNFPKGAPWETILDIGIGGIKVKVKYKNTSKHIGIFPEQASQWKWIEDKIRNLRAHLSSAKSEIRKEIKILNLFGYTGIASLVAAKGGAKVTHVDASKQSVDWARENQKLSGLVDAPIRWIVDDVLKFIKKEIGRGEKYDAIIMDPPSYGKGPKGEVWKIEEKLPELLESCKKVLSDSPLFIIFNMYSTELSSISVMNLLNEVTKNLGGSLSCGELALRHHSAEATRREQENSGRLLPMSIFALWQSGDKSFDTI